VKAIGCKGESLKKYLKGDKNKKKGVTSSLSECVIYPTYTCNIPE
jgi:hypothetical protein